MPQPFFTGNYGASLAQVNTAPIERAGAAMGQAFQSIGTSIASAMEKRRENQEKKEKEELAALQFKGMAKANPDLAAQFGIDINDSGSLDVGAKAFAKNPNSMGLMQQFAQGAQAMQLAKRADERAGVSAESLEKMRQQQLKSGAIDLRIQQALQEGKLKLAKEIMGNKLMQAQAETEFRELGGGSGKTLKKMEDLKVKGEILGTENIQSQIDYREAMAQANINASLAKVYEAQNPDASKTISQISSATTALLKQPVKVRLKNGDKVHVPLSHVLEGKVEKIDKKSESELVASYKSSVEGLNEKMRRELSRLPLEFIRINKETGEQEVVEGTFADKYAYDMAKAEAEEEERLQREAAVTPQTPEPWMYMRGK